MLLCFGDNTALRLLSKGMCQVQFYKLMVIIPVIVTGNNNEGGSVDELGAIIESPFVVYCNGDWASKIEFRYCTCFMILLAII